MMRKTSMPYNPYRLFRQNLRTHAAYYAIGTIAMLLTSLSEALLPKFIQWSLDLVLPGKGLQSLPPIFISPNKHQSLDLLISYFILSLLLGWIGRIGWRQILARQSHLAGHTTKTKIWNVLKDQPISLLGQYPLGDLMNRATADWNKVRFIHGFTIVLTYDLLFFTIFSVVSMLLIDSQLAILCLLILPFLPRWLIRVSKQEYRLHQHAQEQLSSLSDLISQSVRTIRLQRATATEKVWINKLSQDALEYSERQYQVLKTSWKIFIIGALPTLFAYGVLFVFGIWKIRMGELSIGGFVALQSYVLLLQSPLFELGSLISEWQTGFASYHRITEIYNLEENRSQNHHPNEESVRDEDYAIALDDVSHNFLHQEPVLDCLNLRIQAGQRVGIIGPIGSGKSTLLQILAGLIEDYQGTARIYGTPTNRCHREYITKNLTLVEQKTFLFTGSIRYNLEMAHRRTDNELTDVLQFVELWDDVCQFPEGIESWIGESGINLSGGQKQRLALARALLNPTSILLLDDCLSAVDSITEAKILQNLSHRLTGKTVLWTAHRISTLYLCDSIYKLESGHMRKLDLHALQTIKKDPSAGPTQILMAEANNAIA